MQSRILLCAKSSVQITCIKTCSPTFAHKEQYENCTQKAANQHTTNWQKPQIFLPLFHPVFNIITRLLHKARGGKDNIQTNQKIKTIYKLGSISENIKKEPDFKPREKAASIPRNRKITTIIQTLLSSHHFSFTNPSET